MQAILKAAEIYNEAGLHEKGERSGPLGSVALDVLRLFVNLIDFRTGRLEPSITKIMDRLGPVSYTHLTLPTMKCRCRSRWSPYH